MIMQQNEVLRSENTKLDEEIALLKAKLLEN